MKPDVSIIVPTLNRKEYLLGLLESLRKEIQKTKAEIIIVEQGKNNHYAYAVYKTNYFFVNEPGTVHAKNLGAKHAHGKYLFFFDDDVWVKHGVIAAHLKNYEDSMVGAVVGRVLTEGQKVDAHAKNVGKIDFWGTFHDNYSSTIKQDVDTVIGCNMSIRRDLFEKLGGFDKRFTGPALRYESDLSLRIKQAGYRIIFEPRAQIRHLRAPSGGTRKTEGRFRWYFHFFSNETYFFLKHRPFIVLPIILVARFAWIISGKLIAPFLGLFDGIWKYYDYRR